MITKLHSAARKHARTRPLYEVVARARSRCVALRQRRIPSVCVTFMRFHILCVLACVRACIRVDAVVRAHRTAPCVCVCVRARSPPCQRVNDGTYKTRSLAPCTHCIALYRRVYSRVCYSMCSGVCSRRRTSPPQYMCARVHAATSYTCQNNTMMRHTHQLPNNTRTYAIHLYGSKVVVAFEGISSARI